MRLLICLAILAFVRGAPISDGAPEEESLDQVAPEASTEAAALEELTAPGLLEEGSASKDLGAPEEVPSPEESDLPEEALPYTNTPASEEPGAPVEASASQEPEITEEALLYEQTGAAFEEPGTTETAPASDVAKAPEETLGAEVPEAPEVPEGAEIEMKPETQSENPIAPESEPIPEPHEEPPSASPDPEPPTDEPSASEVLAPGSFPDEHFSYLPIFPSEPESEHSGMNFIDSLLWVLFGDDSENEIDDYDFLWPFSGLENGISKNKHEASPVQPERDVMYMIWSD